MQRIFERLLGVEWACEGIWEQSLRHKVVSLIRPFCYGVRVLLQVITPNCKEPSESQKGRGDSSSVLSVSVVQTLENEIRFDVQYTCKERSERSKDRYVLFYTINSMHLRIAKDKSREKKVKKKTEKKRTQKNKKGKNSPGRDLNQHRSNSLQKQKQLISCTEFHFRKYSTLEIIKRAVAALVRTI